MRQSLNGSPRGILPAHQWFQRGITLLTTTDPVWTIAATTFVFVSYLLNLSPYYPWIGIGILCLVFPLRLLARMSLNMWNPFTVSLALLLAGALVGLLVSSDRGISLGAFQSVVALSLFCYSWVTYPNRAMLIKRLILLAPLVPLSILILALIGFPDPERYPTLAFFGTGTHHGLAMSLVIFITILAGIILFGRHSLTRLYGGIISLAFVVITVVLTWDSLKSLFAWISIRGRVPIWEDTIALLADSPFTGLGLGCWALEYYGSAAAIPEPTHVHNAYLELYANTGVLGALALVVALVVGGKLAWDIIRSPRNHPWYGFGVGVVMACVATLLVGIVESAPIGVPIVTEDTYYYLISPVPWILAGLLVAAKNLLKAEVQE